MLGNPISVCGCFRSLSLCLTLPCNHTHMDTHIHTHTQAQSETKKYRDKENGGERSLQSDHSGYFPRVLSVTMEIWKIALAL